LNKKFTAFHQKEKKKRWKLVFKKKKKMEASPYPKQRHERKSIVHAK